MIGDQRTGCIAGVVISMVAHEKPTVTVGGELAQLAIITNDGTVIASGEQVSTQVAAVVINCYRAMWKAQGHLRVYSEPILPIAGLRGPKDIQEQETEHIGSILISTVAHESPTATVDGKLAQLAIITDGNTVIASGQQVSNEVAAVVINCYRAMLIAQGRLRVYTEPILPSAIVRSTREAGQLVRSKL